MTAVRRWGAVLIVAALAQLEGAATAQVVVQPGPESSKDIWTTSVYSYAPGGGGPGGGLDNEILRVGGWGDSYYVLIQFDIAGLPAHASSAVIQLYAIDGGGGGPTSMYLDRITDYWDWKSQGTGSDRLRLWWRDRPNAAQWAGNPLPPPTPNQWYSIDVTDLYNAWQNGTYPNYGVQLRPLNIGNNWSVFNSSEEAGDPALRPKLVVTAAAPPPDPCKAQNDQIAADQTQLAALQAQLADAQAQLASAGADNARLTADNAALTARLAASDQQVQSLTAQNATLTAQNATLTQQNATLTAANTALADQLTQAERDMTALQAQLVAAQTQVAMLQQQNAQCAVWLQQSAAELAAERAQNQAAVAQLLAQLTQAQVDANRLASQLLLAQAQIAALQQADAQCSVFLHDAINQLAVAQASLKTLSDGVNAQVDRVQVRMRALFPHEKVPLTIPGVTPLARLAYLVDAIVGLNHGEVTHLYQHLLGHK